MGAVGAKEKTAGRFVQKRQERRSMRGLTQGKGTFFGAVSKGGKGGRDGGQGKRYFRHEKTGGREGHTGRDGKGKDTSYLNKERKDRRLLGARWYGTAMV